MIALTRGFGLRVADQDVPLPHSAERMLAHLALVRSPVTRARLACELWPEHDDQRAAHNLRTTLWRVRRLTPAVVTVTHETVALGASVLVDVHQLATCWRAVVQGTCDVGPELTERLISHDELLPGWEDVWVVDEREAFRLLRLDALESASTRLITEQRYGDALRLALGAVTSEPLRESAWRLLVRIHLLQGNVAEALRAYQRYRAMLLAELDIAPSALMQDLVRSLVRSGGRTSRP